MGNPDVLLPHFLTLIVGKPGSGKSSLIEQFLNSSHLYRGRFDDVFVVSPSWQKIRIPGLTKGNTATDMFSTKWIQEKIDKINMEQVQKIEALVQANRSQRFRLGAGDPANPDRANLSILNMSPLE